MIANQLIVMRTNRTKPRSLLFASTLILPILVHAEIHENTEKESSEAQIIELRETFLRDAIGGRKPLSTIFPDYPSIARRDRIEGEATVCFKIDIRGSVKRVSVKSYTHKIFRKPALRAIRDSSFEPLRPDQILGRTKACRTYRFRLDPVAAGETGE